MQKRSKRILAATLAAAGVLVASGIAYAAFTGSSPSENVTGTTETVDNVVVTGALVDPSLWPNQATNVNLYVDNPNNDIPVKVKSVSAVALGPSDITLVNNTDPVDVEFCRARVQTVGVTGLNVDVPANGTDVQVVVPNGIKLHTSADNRCMGMAITARWAVNFETNYQ